MNEPENQPVNNPLATNRGGSDLATGNPPNREPFISLALYHLFKWSIVSPVLHGYLRGRIYGAKKVPMEGPLIVVSNHASNLDPPLLSNCMRRPVSFMAKESLFQVPVLAPAIRAYGAYPVKRGSADRSAIREALKQLDNGWAVGIFLQGVRTPDGRVTSPKLGAAMIAAKAQVPLLPVSLWGTERILSKGASFPKPSPVTIRIGEPIAPPVSSKDKEALRAVTQQCTDEIHALHDLGR